MTGFLPRTEFLTLTFLLMTVFLLMTGLWVITGFAGVRRGNGFMPPFFGARDASSSLDRVELLFESSPVGQGEIRRTDEVQRN